MRAFPHAESLLPPLLEWYQSHRTPLPWRESKDPYRVWLSEIMLQQTRIEAVIPYYHRFLAAAPTVKELAELDDERLMKLWEGLGYYSRARNLKRAAEQIMSCHGGTLPQTFAELRALPGIGDYTAGAIASIAFGLPEPAVDGNVLRVIMRVTGSDDDIAIPATKRYVTQELRHIYPHGKAAGDLTEALMELGERICLPVGTPKCDACPWCTGCIANRERRQAELPRKSPKKEKRVEEYTVLLFLSQGKTALQKRADKGLLAGLWGFPMLPGKQTEETIAACLAEQGIVPLTLRSGRQATHIFTHIIWNMQGVIVETERPFGSFLWVGKEELLRDTAIPTAFQAYVREFLQITEDRHRDE